MTACVRMERRTPSDLTRVPRYAYDASMEGESPSYIYSQQAVDLIWGKIKEDPSGVIDRLRSGV